MNNRLQVAFICVHNSCRSQIAEALGKYYASDIFDSYSAGTETKPQINQDAVRLMKEIYGIDMEKTQHSKLITDLPEIDVVVKMGCNVVCPFVPSKHEEDWGLDDPTGKSDEEFRKIISIIDEKVKELREKLKQQILRPVKFCKMFSENPQAMMNDMMPYCKAMMKDCNMDMSMMMSMMSDMKNKNQ